MLGIAAGSLAPCAPLERLTLVIANQLIWRYPIPLAEWPPGVVGAQPSLIRRCICLEHQRQKTVVRFQIAKILWRLTANSFPLPNRDVAELLQDSTDLLAR